MNERIALYEGKAKIVYASESPDELVLHFKDDTSAFDGEKVEQLAHKGELYLGDEFSPDGCRLWDARSLEKMDKDRFRRGLGGVVEAYAEVARRLGVPLPAAS